MRILASSNLSSVYLNIEENHNNLYFSIFLCGKSLGDRAPEALMAAVHTDVPESPLAYGPRDLVGIKFIDLFFSLRAPVHRIWASVAPAGTLSTF